jgi:hypothetical protein
MLRPPFYLALLLLTQCGKSTDTPVPLDELPPATQTGANTFGCFVNDQVWTPGNRNATVTYALNYNNGNLELTVYRVPDANSARRQTLALGVNFVTRAGTYPLDLAATASGASFTDRAQPAPCNSFSYVDISFRTGTLTVTRLDQQAGIIAGTFKFTLAKSGCDTVRVNNGRFDQKF